MDPILQQHTTPALYPPNTARQASGTEKPSPSPRNVNPATPKSRSRQKDEAYTSPPSSTPSNSRSAVQPPVEQTFINNGSLMGQTAVFQVTPTVSRPNNPNDLAPGFVSIAPGPTLQPPQNTLSSPQHMHRPPPVMVSPQIQRPLGPPRVTQSASNVSLKPPPPPLPPTNAAAPMLNSPNPRAPESANESSAAKSAPAPVKRKLEDFIISGKASVISPNFVGVYNKLRHVEQTLEKTIFHRRIDMEEWIRRAPKIKQTLRLYISNSSSTSAESPDEFSWKLKISGHLIDEHGMRVPGSAGKFTNFINNIILQLDPNIFPENLRTIKWSRPPNHGDLGIDGVDVTRKSSRECIVLIRLGLDVSQPRYVLKEPLAKLLNLKTEPLSKIRMALWEYIKTHNLQDPADRKVVLNDEPLKEIFKDEKMHFSSISHRLAQFLQLADVVDLKYLVRNTTNTHDHESIYDIQVEVDSKLQEGVKNYLKNASKHKDELVALDNQIADAVQRINERLRRHEFLSGFVEAPSEFLVKAFESQNKDQQILKDCVGPNPEELRRSEYYQKPWVKQASARYLEYVSSRLQDPPPS